MTIQNQAYGQMSDLLSCGFRHGSGPAGMFAMVAKGTAPNCFRTAIAACKLFGVELVAGLRQLSGGFWRKESDGRGGSILESKAFRDMEYDVGRVEVSHGNVQRGRGYYETGCKILKQVADRFHYKCQPWEKAVCGLFMSSNYGHRINVSNGLSEREAKFFLDRGIQSRYNALKFSGGFPARAKIHLHTERKIVNCCSRFWERADQPLAGHESTRFREAETGRPNKLNESIPQLRSLRDDRPVGVISIPSAHGRRRI
jgi:hypothetical protein